MGARAYSAPDFAEAPVADLHLPARSDCLMLARLFVRRASAACGLGRERSSELEYAFNEAVTNAIRHGRPDARGQIRLSALCRSDRLTLAVHDSGTFAMPLPIELAQESPEGGRGLALMARFADEIEISNEPGATTVRISKRRL